MHCLSIQGRHICALGKSVVQRLIKVWSCGNDREWATDGPRYMVSQKVIFKYNYLNIIPTTFSTSSWIPSLPECNLMDASLSLSTISTAIIEHKMVIMSISVI